MSGKQPFETKATPASDGAGRGLRTAIASFFSLGAIAALYVMGLAACKPPSGSPVSLASLAHGAMSKLQIPETPAVAPDAAFVDPSGKSVTLAAFKGQAVVLNLWATWCAPCVKEMPTLAQLQTAFAGQPVKVLALSTDGVAQTDKAKSFMAAHPPLGFYQDPHFAVAPAITPHIEGFPTTLLYNRSGQLKGVLQGEADWSSPEAKAVIAALLKS